ncbi:MAG: hypothetical protein GHHEDOFH_01822 [Pseudorhodoplanes sp.]|nr:hypothetical protein [Pseudorhodoplanes sp.]
MILRSGDFEDAGEALLDAAERVVDQHVFAGDFELELHRHRAAGRNRRGLHVVERLGGERTLVVHAVEDFTDHVERGGVVRAADAEIDAHRLADLGLERLLRRERADCAVEQEEFRPLVDELVVAFGQLALGADLLLGVKLALHHVEFVVDLRQAAFRLDQDQPVHAVGDVLGRHRHRAVIDIKARIERGELEAARRAGLRIRRLGAAARSGHGMEVDIVHQRAVFVVFQLHLDGVADAHADERAGDLLVEGPVAVGRPVGELAGHLDGFEIDLHALRAALADRLGQVGRAAHDRDRGIGFDDLAHVVGMRSRSACGLGAERGVGARLGDERRIARRLHGHVAQAGGETKRNQSCGCAEQHAVVPVGREFHWRHPFRIHILRSSVPMDSRHVSHVVALAQ